MGFKILAATLGFALWAQAAAMACPYATLQLDVGADAEAICAAAEPLHNRGVRVLVWLTDVPTLSETAWFDRIDAVEAAAGLRDSSQIDTYALNGITLALNTDTGPFWGINATFGENYWDRPADRRFEQIRSQLRPLLTADNPTAAAVLGLEQIYTLNYPPSPWRTLLPLGAIAGAGIAAWQVTSRKARQKRWQTQVATLQGRTATLLLALEQWLPGQDPESMLPYQLFMLLGGAQTPRWAESLRAALQQARQALDTAFELRSELEQQQPTSLKAWGDHLEAWERLYVAIVGNSPNILALSDADLETLLSPDRYLLAAAASQLSEPLDRLRQQLKGQPLQVELMRLKAEPTPGILGWIYDIDQRLSQAEAATTLAPQTLAALENRRQALSTSDTFDWGLVVQYLDRDFEAAQAAAAAGQWLACLERCETIEAHWLAIAIVEQALVSATTAATIRTDYQAQGFRLSSTAPLVVEQSRQQLSQQIHYFNGSWQALIAAAQDYQVAIATWIEDLHQPAKLYRSNEAALGQLSGELQRLDRLVHGGTNAFALNDIRAIYQQIKSDLERALQKNTMDVQDFEAVQADIGQIRKNMSQLSDKINRARRTSSTTVIVAGSHSSRSSASGRSSSSRSSSSRRSSSGGSSRRSSGGGRSRRR